MSDLTVPGRFSSSFLPLSEGLLDAVPALVVILSPSARIIAGNDGWRAFVTSNGFTGPDYGLGLEYLQLCQERAGSEAQLGEVQSGLRAVLAGELSGFAFELPWSARDNRGRFQVWVTPLIHGERVRGAIITHVEVTETDYELPEPAGPELLDPGEQQALARSGARLEAALDHVPFALWACDSTGRLVATNAAFEALWGDQVGRTLETIVVSNPLREHWLDLHRRALEGQIAQHETRSSEPGGIAHLSSTMPVRDDNRILGVLGIHLDLTQKRLAEELLLESQRSLTSVLTQLPGFAYRCLNLPDWPIERISDGVAELTGYTPADFLVSRRASWGDIIHPEHRQPVWDAVQQALAERRAFKLIYRITTADGRDRWVWEHGRGVFSRDGQLLALEGFVTDIVQRRRVAEQLMQTPQIETVGRLAGGVLHDFNNLLTAILGSASLTAQGGHEAGAAEIVRTSAERAEGLARQLLTFARTHVEGPRAIDLGQQVATMERSLRKLLGQDVEIILTRAKGLWPIQVDPKGIEQVVVNLAVNARSSMPAGGRLTIETSNHHESGRSGELPAGDYVVLAMSDTGVGMSADLVARIFEPLSTGTRRGMGAGLASSYNIVRRAGGHILVNNEPGRGTVFRTYLPRLWVDRQPTPPPAPSVDRRRPIILLVEDEPLVMQVAAETLRASGYQVLTAENGSDAVELVAGLQGPLDLLLSDVVLPDKGGREVAAEIARLRPGLPTLFMSGYGSDDVTASGLLAAGVDFIQKPFTISTLATKVRQVLEAGTARS